MNSKYSLFKFIAQSIIAGLAIGFLIVFFKPYLLPKNNVRITEESNHAPASYASAVNKIAPSVVSIYAQSKVRKKTLSPEMQRFMGLRSLVPQSVTQQYLGSGVVMSDDGYIVTNFHVIQNATQIIVSLWDNSLLEAKIIGSDRVTDIAVLKVEAVNLKPAVFADSDQTQTGDIVMAVGNPYGLSQSVSLGIVSAKGRSGLHVSTIENFIQTDAAINEGNSGGALINAAGNVVGISTATFNQEGAQGINFAIPSNATRLIMQEILNNGKVLRGWLGIVLYAPQSFYGSTVVKPQYGVMIHTVYPKFPAEKVGLVRNDIITHINDVVILNPRHYHEIIAESRPGETLNIIGFSGGKPFTKKVETVERPLQIR